MSGLAVLSAIVLAGLVTGAGFYRFKRQAMDARVAADLETAPESPEERAALWLRFGGPQIHHRLSVVARFGPEQPWLVTHAVASPSGEPVLWGIDCGALPQGLARLEGLTVVVELPSPKALGRAPLHSEQSRRVPLFAPDARLDPAQRLRELALYMLEGLPRALERDVPGAKLEIRVLAE